MIRVDYAVHIVAGALGIFSGFVALFASKGARVHRRSGTVFVYAMMTMALMGAMMAFVHDKAPWANGPVGALTAYLVITSFLTVRPRESESRSVDVALLVVVALVTATLLRFGFAVLASPTGKLYGMPAAPFLIFGAIGMLAVIGDVRAVRAGGVQTIRGRPRLVRHLWRMTTALLIAAFSFFLGQAKVIPKPIRIVPLLLVPPLVVLASLLYWLWRVRFRRSLAGLSVRVMTSAPVRMRSKTVMPAPR
jgi:hypothetical protein